MESNVAAETDHHFLPALVAPFYFRFGIGVEFVVGRVIEVRGAFDNRAGGE